MKYILATLVFSLALLGCQSTVQTTSGSEYLSKYKEVPVSPGTQAYAYDSSRPGEIRSIDQRIRDVAAVEPVLRFPARIGLARIDNGILTNIPAAETESWNKARDRLGNGFGEFVPVNPMIAKMVGGNRPSHYEDRVSSVIDGIRLGAARQHLDAVLIYEVISKENSRSNILALADASIIGGFILPSTQHDAEGLGNAILIDVVQGYPYGTINTVVEKESRITSSWGWGTNKADEEEFSNKVKAKATEQLADEAYDMFMKLRAELAEKRLKR